MGRRKIQIEPLKDDRNRSVTFLKRKSGLFKKAYELGVLCSADVAIIVFNQSGKLFEYSSGNIDDTLLRYTNYAGQHHEKKGPQDFAPKGSTLAMSNGQGMKRGGGGGGSDDDEDEEDDDDDQDYGAGYGASGSSSRNTKKRRRQSPDANNHHLANQHGALPVNEMRQQGQQQQQQQLPMLPPMQQFNPALAGSMPPELAAQFAQAAVAAGQQGGMMFPPGFAPYLPPHWQYAPTLRMGSGSLWSPTSLPGMARGEAFEQALQQHQQQQQQQMQQQQMQQQAQLFSGQPGQQQAHTPFHMLNLLASHPAFAQTALEEQQRSRSQPQQTESPDVHLQRSQSTQPISSTNGAAPSPPQPQHRNSSGTVEQASPRSAPARSASLNTQRPSLSVSIPGQPSSRIDTSNPIVQEPEQLEQPSNQQQQQDTASARPSRYAADILPSPSAFLNDSAYSGYAPLSALASTAAEDRGSALFHWPKPGDPNNAANASPDKPGGVAVKRESDSASDRPNDSSSKRS